ncbi:MAG: hypothetical protein WA738_18135 [Candidatus Angelobacter sp.]
MRNKTIASKYSVFFFALIVALLATAGCGGGGQSASTSPNPSPTPTPTTSPSSASLTASPTSLGFGSQVLNTPVTLPVKITNVGTAAVTLTQDSITGSGFSVGITTPINLNPTQSLNVPVVFTPTASGSVAGTFALMSNGTTLISVPLSGTGLAPRAHSVDVAWNASTASTLLGYNVYRSGVSGGPYTKISPTLSSTTLLFTDTTPLSGQKYFYVVTDVSTGGVESAASAEVAVTIPTP